MLQHQRTIESRYVAISVYRPNINRKLSCRKETVRLLRGSVLPTSDQVSRNNAWLCLMLCVLLYRAVLYSEWRLFVWFWLSSTFFAFICDCNEAAYDCNYTAYKLEQHPCMVSSFACPVCYECNQEVEFSKACQSACDYRQHKFCLVTDNSDHDQQWKYECRSVFRWFTVEHIAVFYLSVVT